MPTGIDVNRGVMIKKHPSMGLVYMYLDTPGVFLNAFGKEIPEAIAGQAFFDIEPLGKERIKRERMREAMTAIELELELANSADEETVLWSRGTFRVVKLALGNAYLYDGDEKLTPVAIPAQEAKVLLDHLAPEEDEKGEKDGGAKT